MSRRLPSLIARSPAQLIPSIPLPTNLPRSLTPFIGREPELTALGELLQIHSALCSRS
jgi:hypothetical protein